MVLGGVAKLGQINTEGKICDTWGSISRDATGAILSCQSGVWRKSSGLSNRVVRQASDRDTAVVYCASDETLTGGSASCNSNSDLRVKYSGPTGSNGWSGACPGTTTTVFAICFKK
ncbi:shufflon system plasmid conjugative transfer pilus tip adhesin PilV [Erwinia rhapontici]|uniref:shufflon system plasmid conjugative transfer pilus tip adhesin PilV n=1 Tax=Erwinia rhapontici TaxID=55212 RepID=UPI0023568B60|nr:shufflon system plasmid conjugative transfer pilus tip adhesin PilV [Erwinia rhapontici]